MTVEQRMAEATTISGMCHTCKGHIRIAKVDFLEVPDQAPDVEAQFDALKDIAARGAATKCGGCTVNAVGGYNKDTLDGEITCTGVDISGIPM